MLNSKLRYIRSEGWSGFLSPYSKIDQCLVSKYLKTNKQSTPILLRCNTLLHAEGGSNGPKNCLLATNNNRPEMRPWSLWSSEERC